MEVDHLLVFVGVGRVADPVEVPVFGVVQVGEAAIDQRAHEIHGHRRTRMRLDHPARIRDARLGSEFLLVHQVAAIAGQGHAVAGFGIGGTRLGVLAGEAAHAHHRQAQAMHQHQAHLQQDFQAVGNQPGLAVAEAFRAIAALQQEALAFLRFGQLLLQRENFPGSHQRRQPPQLAQRRFQRLRIRIGGHLHRRARAPGSGRPLGGNAHGTEIAVGVAHGVFPWRITMLPE